MLTRFLLYNKGATHTELLLVVLFGLIVTEVKPLMLGSKESIGKVFLNSSRFSGEMLIKVCA